MAVMNRSQNSIGTDDDNCDFNSSEILISSGEVADQILLNADNYQCDQIVLGAKESFVAGT